MHPGFLERKRLERAVSSIRGLTTATQSRACYCPHHCTGGCGGGVRRGWPLVTQLLRPSAHALWRRGRPGTTKVAARVGAARVLGFAEDAQMAAPPDAKSQGPVSRFRPFRPLGVARGRQL